MTIKVGYYHCRRFLESKCLIGSLSCLIVNLLGVVISHDSPFHDRPHCRLQEYLRAAECAVGN